MFPRDLWAQAQQLVVIIPCSLHSIRAVHERTDATAALALWRWHLLIA